jgi:hypothetical protein
MKRRIRKRRTPRRIEEFLPKRNPLLFLPN